MAGRDGTCLTAGRCRARRPGRSRPGRGSASKPPVGEDSVMSATAERIGFLGLGIMGSRMAANLSRAGYELSVWTHTPGKAEAWAAEHGAKAFASPVEVAEASDVVFSMVVDGEQVASVLLGPGGAIEAAREGLLCVDCSTIAP